MVFICFWSNYFFIHLVGFDLVLNNRTWKVKVELLVLCLQYLAQIFPDQKSGTPFCDFNKRSHLDRKNHTTVTYLNFIYFIKLFYSFIFQRNGLLKFANYSQNIQQISRILILCISCTKLQPYQKKTPCMPTFRCIAPIYT